MLNLLNISWFTSLLLVILPIYPRTSGVTHTLGIFSLFLVIILYFRGYFSNFFTNIRYFKPSIIIFFISVFIATLNGYFHFDFHQDPWYKLFTGLWHTLRAFSVALLFLISCQHLNRLFLFSSLWCQALFLRAIVAPLFHYLNDIPVNVRIISMELATTYSARLWFNIFGAWISLLISFYYFHKSKDFTFIKGFKFSSYLGYLLPFLFFILQYRSKLPSFDLDTFHAFGLIPKVWVNIFISFLVFVLGLLFWYFWNRSKYFKIFLPVLTLLFSGFNIFISFSRWPILVFLLVNFGLLFFYIFQRRWKLLFFSLTIFFLLTSLVYFSNHRVKSADDSHRWYIFRSGMNIFYANPLLGTGYGIYTCNLAKDTYKLSSEESLLRYNVDYSVIDYYHTHNIFIQLLSERGIFGFLVFWLLYLTVLINFLIVLYRSYFLNLPSLGRLWRNILLWSSWTFFLIPILNLADYWMLSVTEIYFWVIPAFGIFAYNKLTPYLKPF